MYLHDVKDFSPTNLKHFHYDLALFASGYEERCLSVPEALRHSKLANVVVIGFDEERTDEQRQFNDKYFLSNWVKEVVLCSSNDEQAVYSLLNDLVANSAPKDNLRILVDYSSMSRLWYSAVLNWARFFSGLQEIRIDMLYAPGVHRDKIAPIVINDILSIPGCEGSSTSLFSLFRRICG